MSTTKKIKVSGLPVFDAAEHLGDDERITEHLAAAIKENDPSELAHALCVVARAQPSPGTVQRVLTAHGVKLNVSTATNHRTHVRPLVFELQYPDEQERCSRVFTPVSGEPFSDYLLRQFAEIERTWALDSHLLGQYREGLARVVENIEAEVQALGGQHLAIADLRVQHWIAEAERIVANAGSAYAREKGYSYSAGNSLKAKAPRKNPELEACIERTLTKPGTAKEQWPQLKAELEGAGLIVRDTQTKGGNPAYEVDFSEGAKLISLKTFENRRSRKSRQPG